MSLILDALRKSEAERRRGQAPDLFASVPAPSAPRPDGWSRYWPAPVLAVLLLGAGFVFWHDRTAGPAASAGADRSELPIAAPSAAAAASPVAAAAAPPVPGAAVPGASGPPAPPVPIITKPTSTAAAPAAPTAAAVAPAPGPGATSVPAAARPSPPPVAIAPPSPAAAPPSPPAAQPAASSATVATAPDDAAEDLPPIAVLGAGERAALPPLKLSMHVWNSEPGKRFAIIDGQRLTEGSSAGASVVEEIRRDGVVLNINGRRVLLPRP